MATSWEDELEQAVDRRFDQMVAIRRHLHQHPEVSGEERETSFYLYQLLGDEGLGVRMGPDGRGIIVDIPVETERQARGMIGLRADIDALRIHDEKQVAYRSQVDGVMHACGHDVHAAIGCGALLALSELETRRALPWPIRVRGILQPSEESAQGAKEMIEVGAMEAVDAILALHVDPSIKVGKIGVRSGVLTANCDEIEFHVEGRGGHAARPHEASDPVAAAAQLINALYLFIPRLTDSRDAVVVTIGQAFGGHTANVIPEEVILRGTIRTLERDVRTMTFRNIERLAEGVGTTSDSRIHVRAGSSTPSVVNDAGLIEFFRQAATRVIGSDGIEEIARPSMGSEDFAYYLECAPGAMIRLGSTSDRIGGSTLHTPCFDIDEQSLRIGAKILAHTAVDWSDPRHGSLSKGDPAVAEA